MHQPTDRLQEPGYQYWIRCILALLCLKEGLHDVTDRLMQGFHDSLTKSVQGRLTSQQQAPSEHGQETSTPYECTSCTFAMFQKRSNKHKTGYPCTFCSTWYDIIVSYHVDHPRENVVCSNFDPRLWPAIPWEVVKVFMPHGCENQGCASDCDPASILTLWQNCQYLRGVADADKVKEVLQIRHSLMHSKDFQMEESECVDATNTMVGLLESLKDLTEDEKRLVQETIMRIKELPNQKMDSDSEIRALKEGLTALQRQQYQTQCQYTELESRCTMLEQQLENAQHKKAVATDATCRACNYIEASEDLQKLLFERYQQLSIQGFPLSAHPLFRDFCTRPTVRGMTSSSRYSGFFSCHQLNRNDKEKYRNIFVAGDIGAGKTVFCKRLAQAWSKNDPMFRTDKEDPDIDMHVLADFKFLFYLDLKDVNPETSLDDLIRNQLLKNVAFDVNVSRILEREHCLVILDGIDEWLLQGADVMRQILDNPLRQKLFRSCTFVMTCQPVTFGLIHVEKHEKDDHLQLCNIPKCQIHSLDLCICNNDNECLTSPFATDIEYLLNPNFSKKIQISDFLRQRNNAEMLMSMPFFLIQSVLLWYNGRETGSTQLEIFCNTLKYTFEELYKPNMDTASTSGARQTQTPHSIQDRVIAILSAYAFNATFNTTGQKPFRIRHSELTQQGLTDACIEFIIQCGILAKASENQVGMDDDEYLHFSSDLVQYALAAIHVESSGETEQIMTVIKTCCLTLEPILQRSRVFVHLSGVKSIPLKTLFEYLANVISTSHQIVQYRRSCAKANIRLVTLVQSFIIECTDERIISGQNGYVLLLEDVIISDDSIKKIDVIETLIQTNTSHIKSIVYQQPFIGFGHMEETSRIERKLRHTNAYLPQLSKVQKVHIESNGTIINDRSLTNTLANCINSLHCVRIAYNMFSTPEDFTSIYNCVKSLSVLDLHNIELTHEHIEQLLVAISETNKLTELTLNLRCTDHKYSSTKDSFELDLANLRQLSRLQINRMQIHVKNLPALANTVEYLKLNTGEFKESILVDFINTVSSRANVVVELCGVSIPRDCNTLESELRDNKKLTAQKINYSLTYSNWTVCWKTIGNDR